MEIWQLALIVGSILAGLLAFVWVAFRTAPHKPQTKGKKGEQTTGGEANNVWVEGAEKDVEHIFNEEFREELRNRGRLHFEKIIGENAMFLQQDLRLTTSQLNEYMKQEITKKLEEEFAKYEESITDAKQLALDSINKTQQAIEQQRQVMSQQLQQEVEEEKRRLIRHFHENLADIVNHYVLAAIGDQIDLNDQLEYILADLEANKGAIIQDITDGA